jgi:hypothetical protein
MKQNKRQAEATVKHSRIIVNIKGWLTSQRRREKTHDNKTYTTESVS